VTSEVVGRDEELRSVFTFLERVAEGPAALVLEGAAGIGKSTLWLASVEAARERGFRVLCSRPSEAEQGLAHAALGDLLENVLEVVLPALPAPRRRALEVALLVEDAAGRPVDPRTLAVAVRSALAVLAAEGWVVLAIDDVQWLDSSSASALAFSLRRLTNEPILLLLARRSGEGKDGSELVRALDAERVDRMPVGPLSLGAIHRIVGVRIGRMLARSELLSVYEASGGNPFFALELSRALDRLPRPPAAGEGLPVPAELGALLVKRVADLPSRTIERLRVAAMLARPTLGLLEATDAGDVVTALQPAVDAGLIGLDGDRLRFAHPLFAVAVASQLKEDERCELHGRLADIVEDLEQRAYHLALASEGPDEKVAGTLEAAAEAAAARGAAAAAADLFELAAARSVPGQEQARRRLRASAFWVEVGDDARALRLAEPFAADLSPGRDRARALIQLSYLGEDYEEGVRLGEEALRQPGLDDPLAAELHIQQANNYTILLEFGAARPHAAAAIACAERTGDPALRARALRVVLTLEHLAGNRLSEELVHRALALEQEAGGPPIPHSPSWLQADRLFAAGRLDDARRFYEARRRHTREYGFDSEDAQLAFLLAQLECHAGRLDVAERLVADYAGFFGDESRLRVFGMYAIGLVAAYAGRLAEAQAIFAERAEHAERRNLEGWRAWSLQGLAFVDLSLGDAPAALERLLPLFERLEERGYRHPTAPPVLPSAAEAAIAAGELETARDLVERLEGRADTLGEPWPLALAARCRGLLAAATGDLEASFAAFDRALGEHARIPMPFEHARTLLALGAAQRRARRRAAARETLQQALRTFERVQTPVWAEKARTELARIGGRPREKDLTTAERRVADLVAEGRSNREVAAALFLSERTVASHLTHIYAKLGLRSRSQLVRKLS
jgi:DNA-binding CsgD family transcriptional regulator